MILWKDVLGVAILYKEYLKEPWKAVENSVGVVMPAVPLSWDGKDTQACKEGEEVRVPLRARS